MSIYKNDPAYPVSEQKPNFNKPFTVTAYKAGKNFITRAGEIPDELVCFNIEFKKGTETPVVYTKNGQIYVCDINGKCVQKIGGDLFEVLEEEERFVIIRNVNGAYWACHKIFKTQSAAEEYIQILKAVRSKGTFQVKSIMVEV